MENYYPTRRSLGRNNQFLLLVLTSMFVATACVLHADLAAGAGAGLDQFPTLAIGCFSAGLIGVVIGKRFGCTKIGATLGLFVAVGTFSYIFMMDFLVWHRAITGDLNGQVSFLTNLAEPFTRML